MNSYEELLNEAAASDITVIENADFKSQSHGLIYGDIIGLNKNIQTDTERSCILAEELGHYYTSTGDIIDQTNVQNRKQEHRARMWAYAKLLPLQFFIFAFKHGCHSTHDTAEFLEVSEEFLKDCINAYHSKYGVFMEVSGYIFIFSENSLNIISKENL